MIIDCHGHYTTAPAQLQTYRDGQIARARDPAYVPARGNLGITDDEIRQSLEGAQLKIQRERGTDMTIFSPRAMGMGHHIGGEGISRYWSEECNELIHRVCTLYPNIPFEVGLISCSWPLTVMTMGVANAFLVSPLSVPKSFGRSVFQTVLPVCLFRATTYW